MLAVNQQLKNLFLLGDTMKTKIFASVFFCLVLLSNVSCHIKSAYSSVYDSLTFKGLIRTYLIHVPPGYINTTPTSLIIALHGGFGSALNIEDQSKLSLKSDRANFIVVYPEGIKVLGVRTWNAGGCCGTAESFNIDDVGFIDALIKKLSTEYNIDQKKIFATGISNGGMMSYRLANDLANKIAAIAPVAATMVIKTVTSPSRPVPIIHFHSFNDKNVPYLGGVGSGVSGHYNPPLDSVFNVWMNVNSCVKRDTIKNNQDYLFVKWSSCNKNSEIHFYMTHDGGHSWPGGGKYLPGDEPSRVINADDLMWDFFQAHPMQDGPTDAVKENTIPIEYYLYQNYPNPFNPSTVINYQLPAACYVSLKVFDVLGNEVATLVNEFKQPGVYNSSFYTLRSSLSSGVYFYTMKAGNFSSTKKMILMR